METDILRPKQREESKDGAALQALLNVFMRVFNASSAGL